MDTPSIFSKIRQTKPSQDVQVLDNLVMFRVNKQRFRYGQSYALLRDDQMILIDAVHQVTQAAVDRWRERYEVAMIVLTHSDLISQAFGSMTTVSEWLNAPVLIHSQDSQGQEVQVLEDAHERLARHQLSYFYIPGHTPGSAMLYAEPERFLFSGDSAVGAHYDQEKTEFTHPPMEEDDWKKFEQNWQSVKVPVNCLLPLHGKPNFAVSYLEQIKQSLLVPDNVMQE